MNMPLGGNDPRQHSVPGWSMPPSGGFSSPGGQYPQQPFSGPPSSPMNFGVAGGGGNAPAAPKKSRRALALVIAGVIVAALGITAFWQPGFLVSKVFDQAAQEEAIKNLLVTSFAIPGVESVSCPADQEVKPGTTFPCQVKVAGQNRTVTITVKDSEGNYEVSALK